MCMADVWLKLAGTVASEVGRDQAEVVIQADQLGLFAGSRNADVHHLRPDLNE